MGQAEPSVTYLPSKRRHDARQRPGDSEAINGGSGRGQTRAKAALNPRG
jgi:hypothetical protein